MPAGGKPRLLAKRAQQPTLTDLQYVVQVRDQTPASALCMLPALRSVIGTQD